jgi:hypothetical protein
MGAAHPNTTNADDRCVTSSDLNLRIRNPVKIGFRITNPKERGCKSHDLHYERHGGYYFSIGYYTLSGLVRRVGLLCGGLHPPLIDNALSGLG